MPIDTAQRRRPANDRWTVAIKIAAAVTALAGVTAAVAALMHYLL